MCEELCHPCETNTGSDHGKHNYKNNADKSLPVKENILLKIQKLKKNVNQIIYSFYLKIDELNQYSYWSISKI